MTEIDLQNLDAQGASQSKIQNRMISCDRLYAPKLGDHMTMFFRIYVQISTKLSFLRVKHH
ncbi:hypothetical protein I8748_12525 [Nostoc sp. CENA67]|uniref:Uncharacterized protein n=1 Tax=Amazonocrinis nigriterrae CENA67 TaxID=2794033 RepID=A0A8J7HT24_9NOST|nr:hypothetical protein [Amazonocrinis nigriterrae]MBH8562997.1 hypothetical protein [Amazonocrinis nigriterrae CENA67]